MLSAFKGKRRGTEQLLELAVMCQSLLVEFSECLFTASIAYV